MCFVNIHIQNNLTKYGFWSASEVIKAFSDFHFFYTIFFPHAPPPFQKKYLKCVLPIFIIYNIALQNTDYGVLHKSSKHFMISIFFPPVVGDTPSLSHTRSVLRASNNDLFCSFRERGGGGEVVIWIIKGTLLFLRNINWGSYEKIIRIYFLYEILKESIFFKKIS